MPKKQKEPSFEQALSELETLVETLEKGNLPLDESLKSFERGVALTRQCQASLDFAEQKVQILSGNKADDDLEPFDEHED